MAPLVVRADEVELFPVLLGRGQRRRAADNRAVGIGAHHVRMPLLTGQRGRLRNRVDKQHLHFLGHLRDCQGHPATDDTHDKVNFIAGYHAAKFLHGDARFKFVVASHQLNLFAQHTTLGIDLIRCDFVTNNGALGIDGSQPREGVEQADLDRLRLFLLCQCRCGDQC